MKRIGALLIIAGSAVALVVSIYNYFMPSGLFAPLSDTAGSVGALLVIGSSALMLFAGVVLLLSRKFGVLAFIAVAGILLDVLGTGFAAMLLESMPLFVAMVIAGLGWLVFVFAPRRRVATA